jgi:uncharacterized membrane protein YhaH (DUF805 family)
MGFFGAIKTCYKKSFTFSGRATRSEYWWFALFQALLGIGGTIWFMSYLFANPQILEDMKYSGTLPAGFMNNFWIFTAAHFLLFFMPSLSAMVRRLHDTDRSGWWYFIMFVPLIGGIWMLVLLCLPGSNGRNTYGPDPLGPRRRLNDHPALMGELDPEIKAAMRAQQQADFKAYYKSRVLPEIQRNKAARGV